MKIKNDFTFMTYVIYTCILYIFIYILMMYIIIHIYIYIYIRVVNETLQNVLLPRCYVHNIILLDIIKLTTV